MHTFEMLSRSTTAIVSVLRQRQKVKLRFVREVEHAQRTFRAGTRPPIEPERGRDHCDKHENTLG